MKTSPAPRRPQLSTGLLAFAIVQLSSCALTPASVRSDTDAPPPILRPALACQTLPQALAHPGLEIRSATLIDSGAVKVPGITEAIPEHCLIVGALGERISPVDGQRYAIGFEMRLPTVWSGRFFYQANGGLDGVVQPAYGDILSGGPRSNGLIKGFAVISSDAGHAIDTRAGAIGGGVFGLDPQARLDYGYGAVEKLTPLAKQIIQRYYGTGPTRSYLVGTSNGGRHGMVAAARDSGEYDGVLASAPGFRLPLAAVTQLWDAQQFASVAATDPASGRKDLNTSFSPAELAFVASKVLERCDELDGLKDGIIANVMACQRSFNALRDIPSCSTVRPHDCLSEERKAVLNRVFTNGPGNVNSALRYAAKAWDIGIAGKDWRNWKFVNAVGPRDPLAVAFVFSTPPVSPSVLNGKGTSIIDYVSGFDFERDGARIFAKDAVYTQSSMEFMLPPDAEKMERFVKRGGKLLVAHGVSDPVFSVLDTIEWYEKFSAMHGAHAADSARLFVVPGMNHSRNGPATDQFDLVEALIAWVEHGQAPQAIVANARGPGTNLPNPELPASWSPTRSRLLCPYPQVARYRGEGDPESALSFACQPG